LEAMINTRIPRHLVGFYYKTIRRYIVTPAMPAARPVVLSGPSGGGKSTILTRAMQEFEGAFAFSVSHTTRKPREGEEHGVHYWFSTKDEVSKMIDNGEFLEHATFGGNTYGTSKKAVNDVLTSGKICVLDVELQGVRNLKKSLADAKYIFIRAPSLEHLEKRLRARGTETEETLQKRLKHAREDMEEIAKDDKLFDYEIVNDDLESAYKQFVNALREDLTLLQRSKQ
ncbi:guk-1, partial [Pristionchus pacificus]